MSYHSLTELNRVIDYAREFFPKGRTARVCYSRQDTVDTYGKAYRQEMVRLCEVDVQVVSRGGRVEITVFGLGDDVDAQRVYISSVIESHRNDTLWPIGAGGPDITNAGEAVK